ncbi:MAG: type II toxin-antitoxin system MqsA family antitoxin [Candidatus Solibacter usitatus]|nr:type II toxin-antitoxin system MqsA family antitoxin [Candidatus Solibacter usitatus]
MTCEVCGRAERERRLIRYSFSQGDHLTVVDHVPAEVCPNCGEVSLSPDVVERLQQTVWQQRAPARLIETPVYEFTS